MIGAEILDRLYAVVESRLVERPKGSYVVELLDGGLDVRAAKLREECEEVIEALREGDGDHLADEVADLVFHTWVAMAAADVSPDRVYAKLEQRFGVGGLAEKAARRRDDGGS
jgi:phosphoribosyl-ATP pyrophosphohydrolase